MKSISIIVPVLNEEGNILPLVKRVEKAVQKVATYEIIFVDDHSTDKTAAEIHSIEKTYPVRYFKKKGTIGKAQSLLEGFSYAQYDLLCMIDSDLQYPPEVLPEMLEKINDGYSVVVAKRREPHVSIIRKIISRTFNFVFCQLLHSMHFDVQSGLKLFKKEIIERVTIRPLPWSFDLEFLLAARSAGYQIASVDITFDPRTNGKSKVNVVWTSIQIGLAAVILKFKAEQIIPFHAEKQKKGQGFHYNKTEFVHYSDLSVHESAVKVFFAHQIVIIAIFFILFIIGLAINWEKTLTWVVSALTIVYFTDLLFNFLLIYRSLIYTPEIVVTDDEIAKRKTWPKYSIFCPLYREWMVVEQFVENIGKMDYPKDKLQVQLLLEEDDKETIEHVKGFPLPDYFKVIVVPHSLPKTKPKACNYGLRFATGEYAVIYDAEDMPDPLQLKKAVLAFEKSDSRIACVQAKLNYYNRSQNLLTRLFTAEYSLWFDLILTGLQSLNAPIPLGGTSNHFKVAQLREVKGWDSFNVTEDCDLGIRLSKRGYRTAIILSDTLEEANSDVGNWINQRSRWIKGYMQTYLVHMRNPMEFLKSSYKSHLITFQLVVGGKILSLFINPFMWATTIAYFTLRAYIGPTIEKLFPGTIFYLAVFSLIFGNFLYMYYYMIGTYRRKQYDLLKYIYLVPLYWLGMSVATWKALIQLILKPHYWQKTKHGLHLKETTKYSQVQYQNDIPQQTQAPAVGFGSRLQKLFISGGVLVVASVLANIMNYLYSGYLTRTINLSEFGVISLISNFLFLTVIPLESLSSSIIYRSAYYLGKYKKVLTSFWSRIRLKGLIAGTAAMILWIILTPWIAAFFNSDNYLAFYVFAPIWLFNTILAVDMGYLTGNHRFTAIALITILTPFIKTIAAITLVSQGHADLVYIAIPLSIVISSIIANVFVLMMPKAKYTEVESGLIHFPFNYFFGTILARFSLVSYLTIDILLVKHFLSPEEAGKYALIALVGKMIFFIGGLFNQFIVPFVSRELGAKTDSEPSFKSLFLASTFSSWIAYIIFGIMGEITAPLLLGNKIVDVAYLLPLYGLGVFAFSIASSIISYHLIKKAYFLPLVTFILSIIQLITISIFHTHLSDVVETMAIIGVVNLVIAIAYHVFESTIHSVFQNFLDFFTILKPIPTQRTINPDKLNILIFNWRDTKHIWAGGAEAYIHGIARKMVEKGHSVTIFCGNDRLSKRYEVVDGVQVIRRGGFFTVYFWALLYYVLKLRGKYDIIIDSVNGIPFFTPFYARIPVVGLIHHVHQEVFREHLPWPLALFACFLEANMMPMVYKNVKMVTVSESTQYAMKYIGFTDKEAIDIVHPGINPEQYKADTKSKKPTILYLGRLKKYKSVHVLVAAMSDIIKKVPNATLTIAGFGESRTELQELIERFKLHDYVVFAGKVAEKTKLSLLAQSWVFVHPSFMEGWGITAIEASASGTAVVASNVPGLRDSVHDGKTGMLVEYGNVTKFAEAITKILTNKKTRDTFEKNGLKWAKEFSWDASAEKMLTVLKKQL